MSTVATHPSYEELCADFEWAVAERELGVTKGGRINIAWHCSDRICELGLASKPALIWEDFAGNGRTYTFDDLRVLSNTIAVYLGGLGLRPGERICLFMDRVPELYIGFLGILKMGGITQPLFSAFGEDSLWTRLSDAKTSAILTQRKHVGKVRKIRERLSELRHIVVVDAGDARLQEREVTMALHELPRVERLDPYPSTSETPSVLHYTSGTTASPRAPSTSTTRSSPSTSPPSGCSTCSPTTSTGATPTLVG